MISSKRSIARTLRSSAVAPTGAPSRAVETSPQGPPRGWHALSGILEHDTSVLGFLSRRDQVIGRCHNKGCRRTCHIDFDHLARTGHGRMPLATIERLLRCQRLEGCALDFQIKRGPGLSLRLLQPFPHVSIRFRCACGHAHAASPTQILARLRAAGGEAKLCSTFEGLAAVSKAPCPKCQTVAWTIDVLWPNVNSIGYRMAQQKRDGGNGGGV